MDSDDILPRRSDDTLAAMAREDLDPLSIGELDARVAALRAEIERVTAHKARATSHRDSADALFKR